MNGGWDVSKIKSTLELVMEKTRDLKMTEGEREAIRRKGLAEKVKSWVQGCLDGRCRVDEVRGHVEEASLDNPDVFDILRMELISRLDPEADNAKLLDLLGGAAGLDVSLIEGELDACRRSLENDRVEYAARAAAGLAARGISGTAVVPNLESDEEWKSHVKETKARLQESLAAGYRPPNQ